MPDSVTAPPLSLAEWIVLALITEQPRHGFAIASLTAAGAEVGRVWQVPRPVVYRAITTLTARDLVGVHATESGRRGPQRSVLTASAEGARAVRRWLRAPVAHIRDARSELLVKLALTDRRGLRRGPLVRAQRRAFAALVSSLEDGLADPGRQRDPFGRLLVTWRLENARAALRFVADVEERE